MKKITFFIIFFGFLSCNYAQKSYQFGIETTVKFTSFQYLNSNGFTLNSKVINPIYGLNFTYFKNLYSFETGLLSSIEFNPTYNYNIRTGRIHSPFFYSALSTFKYYTIPLRFGKLFYIGKSNFYINPEFCFNVMFSNNYNTKTPYMYWTRFNYDQSQVNVISDSTHVESYILSPINFSIEPAFTIGYIKKRFFIYLKGSYSANLKPVLYQRITHYLNSGEIIHANSTNIGNGFAIQVGLKYGFLMKRKNK